MSRPVPVSRVRRLLVRRHLRAAHSRRLDQPAPLAAGSGQLRHQRPHRRTAAPLIQYTLARQAPARRLHRARAHLRTACQHHVCAAAGSVLDAALVRCAGVRGRRRVVEPQQSAESARARGGCGGVLRGGAEGRAHAAAARGAAAVGEAAAVRDCGQVIEAAVSTCRHSRLRTAARVCHTQLWQSATHPRSTSVCDQLALRSSSVPLGFSANGSEWRLG